MANIPTPPPDASGGFLVIKYTTGALTHRMRVHVGQFGFSNPANPAIANDQSYNVAATGQEALLSQTFTNLVNLLKPLYAPAWTFTLDALFQVVAGSNNPTPVPQVPAVAPIAGTGVGPVSAMPESEFIFNFKTLGGHRGRLICISLDNTYPSSPPSSVTGQGAGVVNAIVAYLTGTTTQIVGHDGTRLLAPAHITQPYNRRLRRHYGHA